MAFNPRMRSPKERPLFVVGALVSGACWAALAASLVAVPMVLLGLGFMLIAQAVFLAHVKGNGVRLSQVQLPHLYARCVAAARRLGLAQVPDVYLLQSGGVLNAFATKLLSRKFVVIHSALVDSCEDLRQLDFVIGHEVGHLAAGHLAWNAFLAPAHLVPWLGPAYSRAREYTCDRCGYDFVGELEPSLRGLAVLAAGGRLAGEVDLDQFMSQGYQAGNFWMAVRELCASHPYLCKRVAALQAVAVPGSMWRLGRNPLAHPLAPLLGISTGGVSSVALMVLLYFLSAFYVAGRVSQPHALASPAPVQQRR
jgi:Zn-dependent protease with chaperone function